MKPARQRERVLLDPLGDVDLERVGDLVAEHVIGLAEPGRERHRDARLEALGQTAGAFRRRGGRDVGLGEVRVAGVENERLARGERVVEEVRKTRVPALGHARGVARRLLFLGVVVDVEVLGLQYAEVQPVVVDLVAPEILRLRRPCYHERRAERHGDHGAPHNHGHPK